HAPVYTKPRLYHPDIQREIDHKFAELERNGIVSKVDFSDWGSQVTAIPKPDGSLRICGNYVKLNKITETWLLPNTYTPIAQNQDCSGNTKSHIRL
ncbi:hypothetical protein, partial, partial [Parasitella parasitica]